MLKTKVRAAKEKRKLLNTVREDGLKSEVKDLANTFHEGDIEKEAEIKALIALYYALPTKVPTPVINLHSEQVHLSWSFVGEHPDKRNIFNIYVTGADKNGASLMWEYEAHFKSTFPVCKRSYGKFYQKVTAELQEVLHMFFTISGYSIGGK